MCFSATASFGASITIAAVAVVSFRKARTTKGFAVACIPLFFSVQQAFEGLLWLSLQHPSLERWQGLAKGGFLLFATVAWPVFVPFIAWLLEEKGTQKKWLTGFLILGCCVGSYFLWCLAAYNITPFISGHHISYELHFPGYNKALATSIYLIAAVIPALISSVPPLRWFGAILLVSFCLTALLYEGYVISVWCFFAAVISVEVLLIIRHTNRHTAIEQQ
jgi:hypothetical protein